ncbi:MAG: hypothetical protein M1833_002132 [Piccolia ochrophora]|nr:MAG: hypothetical protein M1833_002132 [Piccolia ochrophora]
MGPPRRNLIATALETTTPPSSLSESQSIARVARAEGNNLYTLELPSSKSMLAELPSRFRSTIWIKRGSFVIVDTEAFGERENKLDGEIVNVVRDEKQWRRYPYWPQEFSKRSMQLDDEDEDSNVGKMPPSGESEDEG